jgi:serine/threonine-protein phosphatase 2A activator
MIKMYRAEVLGKLPVIQHFLFGSILAYEGPVLPSLPAGNQEDERHGHGHSHADPTEAHAGWHDACGIHVPSAFAAAAEAQKEAGVRLAGTRPVPFD